MRREKILVVEDDSKIRDLIRYHLERERYQFLGTDTGEQALALAEREAPDLVLLDLMLPRMDGLEVCRALRAIPATSGILIVLLTARTEEIDIVAGLEAGADDYITKPFLPRVLLARIRAILRRRDGAGSAAELPLSAQDLEVDTARHLVTLRGQAVHLTLTEFRILAHLLRQSGRVVTRSRILEAVQDGDTIVMERTIDVHLASLRKKLGADGARIVTVRGVGYRFDNASRAG